MTTDVERLEQELSLLETNLNWLIENHGLSEVAEGHYRSYLVDVRKTVGVDVSKEKWNPHFNRRMGAQSVRGTNSEMLFEALCYTANLKVEERVSDKKRQIYGEDFVVQARKVSVKTRKHIAGVSSERTEGQNYTVKADTNFYLYREDFQPATWRVDILALVDPDTRQVTTLGYPTLAKMYCTVDSRGFCTPTFQGEKVMLSLHEYSQRRGSFVDSRNLAIELKEKNKDEALHT